jgi:SAM-dependent methyltransferase/uncharacterized protein YbaR (Trm112 family)
MLATALVCPRDYAALETSGIALRCPRGHQYPIIDDIPIMLLEDAEQTLGVAADSLAEATGPRHVSAPGDVSSTPRGVDAYVQEAIAATGGYFYKPLIGSLAAYPIPALHLPPALGARFLDLGCNWGRWCIAAARLGYVPFGIDPSLEAIRAARRVARQLGVEVHYVVGDARFLPFPEQSFEVVHSYSVLQHFKKSDACAAFADTARVLRPDGIAKIQMANVAGIRSLYHQLRRGFREPVGFEVRYWTPSELRLAGERTIGPTEISVDGFFSLNPQPNEMLPLRFRTITKISEVLRQISVFVRPLLYVADSVYLTARKSRPQMSGSVICSERVPASASMPG